MTSFIFHSQKKSRKRLKNVKTNIVVDVVFWWIGKTRIIYWVRVRFVSVICLCLYTSPDQGEGESRRAIRFDRAFIARTSIILVQKRLVLHIGSEFKWFHSIRVRAQRTPFVCFHVCVRALSVRLLECQYHVSNFVYFLFSFLHFLHCRIEFKTNFTSKFEPRSHKVYLLIIGTCCLQVSCMRAHITFG